MSKLLFVVALLAACGSKQERPAEPTPAPSGSAPAPAMTPDECTAKGGHVKGDIGDGKVACDPSEQDLGRVNQGIEGAVCCAGAAGSSTTGS